jgi:Tol biopolymer transport system component
MRHHRSLLLLAALSAGACGGGNGNPFAAFSRTELPTPEADLIFVSNVHDPQSPLREVFAFDVDAEGAEPQQLTFCNGADVACDAQGADMAPDRRRLAVRRVEGDLDRDGDLDSDDGVALYVTDLMRGIASLFVESPARVSGVDWLPGSDLLVYAARTPLGQGAPGIGADDLYRITGTRQEVLNLSETISVLERNPSVNPGGTVAVYERTVPEGVDTDIVAGLTDPVGVSEIFMFQNASTQLQLTTAARPGGARLPGTPYRVGSDADPVFSPDGALVAFRRLTGLGSGRGNWDIVSVSTSDVSQRRLVEGEVYRSGPDWSSRGIVFAESDAASTRLLLLDPDTGSVRVLLTLAAGVRVDGPRWLTPAS